MNKARRKIISNVLESLRMSHSRLEDVLNDENDAYENTAEYFPDSEKTEEMEQNVEFLTEAVEAVDVAIEQLENIE